MKLRVAVIEHRQALRRQESALGELRQDVAKLHGLRMENLRLTRQALDGEMIRRAVPVEQFHVIIETHHEGKARLLVRDNEGAEFRTPWEDTLTGWAQLVVESYQLMLDLVECREMKLNARDILAIGFADAATSVDDDNGEE